MSHWTCEHCGGRFRDEHRCDRDPANVAEDLDGLVNEVRDLAAEIRELEARMTRLETQHKSEEQKP